MRPEQISVLTARSSFVGYSRSGEVRTGLLFAALPGEAKSGHPSDEALMERVVMRDAGGLEQLYDRYSRVVYSLLLRMTGQATSADELLQEVFFRVWNSAARYQKVRGGLAPWLLAVSRNLAIDHLRSKGERQRRQEEGVGEFPAVLPERPDVEGWVDQRRQARRVRDLMAELPAAQVRALEMAYFKGLSHSEIAHEMGEPLGTVKTWIRNALGRLRRAMEEAS